tara:strand:- start:470 stop:1741 length:1272 start_codon:yes stop_codon:yes gene_type:complete
MKDQKSNPEVVTFGCRLNTVESEIIKNHAIKAGLNNATIFNTCGVTEAAEKQAIKEIKKIKKENPKTQIIVTGCAVQINPTKYKKLSEVDVVLGNHEKLQVDSYRLKSPSDNFQISNIMERKKMGEHLISGFGKRTRAFIQIQQGCDHRCTFCIIPFGRGNSRSLPVENIAKQINILLEQGYKEAVLTGVDISSYGQDLSVKHSLGSMVKQLLVMLPNLKRLRLSSLDPAVIDDELLEIISTEPRLMPHLHFSVQAGSDLILKRMKRRHSREGLISLCKKIKQLRPEIVFGADIIVGFPTETEENFSDTLRIVDEADLTYLHVFPFSARPETPAARMPQVERKIIKKRSEILRIKGDKIKTEYFKSLIGKEVTALVEKGDRGYTESFAPIKFKEPVKRGKIVSAKISGFSNERLSAEIMSSIL